MQIKFKFFLYIAAIFIVAIIISQHIHNEQHDKQGVADQINNIESVKYEDIKIDDIKKIEIETDKEVDAQAVKPVSLGTFKLTAYCSCSICCGKWSHNRPIDENGIEIVYGAAGERLKESYSIAVDPSIIPYGTKVIINGNVYKAQDCGGAIKGNEIDIYFENHNEALEFGVQYAEVFILNK